MVALLSLGERPRAAAGRDPAGAAGSLPPAGDSAAPGLDADALARLAELDPTGKGRLIERVLEAFRVSIARLRPQLEAARQGGDRDRIRLVVHTLKSSSASIGALALSQVCARIEAAIRLDAGPEAATRLDAGPEAAIRLDAGSDLAPDLDELGTAIDAALRAIDQTLKARP